MVQCIGERSLLSLNIILSIAKNERVLGAHADDLLGLYSGRKTRKGDGPSVTSDRRVSFVCHGGRLLFY